MDYTYAHCVTKKQRNPKQATLNTDNGNNVRDLAVVERQANVLPGELLRNLERELAVDGLAVHVEDSVGGGVVEHEEHEESRSEDDLDDEGPVFPGPAVDGGGPEEEGLHGGEEEEAGGGEGSHSFCEGGASAKRLEAPSGLDDCDDGGEGPGHAEVDYGEEDEDGGDGEEDRGRGGGGKEEDGGEGEGEEEEVGEDGGGEEGEEGGEDGEERGEELYGAAEEAVEDTVGDGGEGE